MKHTKRITGMLALLVCAALLLGGTMAWTDFTQSKTNKFRGTADPDVTLHDDFDGENKDVYVENSGTADIYVRVRLDEYMEIGGVSFVESATVRDKQSWTTHTYDGHIEDCGHIESGKQFHHYYQWVMTGAQKQYTPGTPGLVSSKLDDNGKVLMTGTHTTAAANAPVTMDGYVAVSTKDPADLTADEQELRRRVDEGCWILDTDGWAYWSQPLAPDTATNLLLDSVTQNHTPNDDWYYGIDVKLQAVTANDFAKWNGNGYTTTTGADALIASWLNG